jgi:hypothetical protein
LRPTVISQLGIEDLEREILSAMARRTLHGPEAPGTFSHYLGGSAIILFMQVGWLRSMEYVWFGESPPAQWPRPEQLTVVLKGSFS